MNGTMDITGDSIVLAGSVNGMSSARYFSGSATSALSINSTGTAGTIFLGTTTSTRTLRTFINNTGGTTTLGTPLIITGKLSLDAGTLANNGNAISLSGSIAGTGTLSGTGTTTLTGSGSTISGVSLTNLTLNNTSGFTLTGNLTVTGQLTLTAGNLDISSYNLTFGPSAPAIAGTFSASKMIIASGGGTVRKSATNAATASFMFPIGDNTGTVEYSPITLTYSGGSYSGYSSVRVVNAKHPSNASSTNYLNRYWSVTQSGFSGSWGCVVVATYLSADIAGTQSNIVMGKWDGTTPWTRFTGSNSGFVLTSPITTFSDFTGISDGNPSVTVSSSASTVCSGTSATLTAAGTDTPSLSYTWAPSGNLSATTGATVTATPAATTVYTVTVTDGNGFTATATKTITIGGGLTVTASGATAICSGSSAAVSTSGGTTYNWAPAYGLSATTGSGVTAAPASTTTYTVTGYTGSCSNQAYVTVTVNPAPTVVNVTGGGAYCGGSTGVSIGLSSSTSGTNYQLRLSGSAVGSPIAGTGSSINFGTKTTAGTYTVLATNTSGGCTATMNGSAVITSGTPPYKFTVTGGGSFCPGGSGVAVGLVGTVSGCNYQLYNGLTATGSPITGTGASISFGPQTNTGTYKVIATNNTTGCTSTMTDSAIVSNFTLPIAYNVTGGGSFCAGGSGLHIGLSGSSTGVVYQLYRGTKSVGNVVSGTGSNFDMGLQDTAGIYSVIAVASGSLCSNNMNGTATISVNALPAVVNVTGGGSFCSGGTGVHIGLSTSTTGISYQLYKGTSAAGSPFSGTGSALDFGLITSSGTYTVVAANATSGCTASMSGSAAVTVNPLPVAYNVNGGGSYCYSGSGVPVGLTGSETSVNYQLYRGTTTVGSPVSGTGAALSFGSQATAGSYAVQAVNTITGCTSAMTGTSAVSVNALPSVYSVTGGGAYCSGSGGVAIGLSNSQTGISYQLYKGGAASGTTVSGTGSTISFGLKTVADTYTVVATNTTSGCTASMNGYSVIQVNSVPVVVSVTGGGGYCAGGAGVSVGLSGSCIGTNYQLYRGTNTVGSPLAGVGYGLDFGLQTTAGNYKVVAINPTTGCTTNMNDSAAVTINPVPTITASQFTLAPAGSLSLIGSPAGGSWLSGSTSIVTVGASTGMASGVALGTTIVGYALPTGCYTIHSISVTPTGYRTSNDNTSGETIAETQEDVVTIAPNPSHGNISVIGTYASQANDNVRISITDIAGRLVYTETVITDNGKFEKSITLTNMPKGMYVMNVQKGEKQQVRKIVIE